MSKNDLNDLNPIRIVNSRGDLVEDERFFSGANIDDEITSRPASQNSSFSADIPGESQNLFFANIALARFACLADFMKELPGLINTSRGDGDQLPVSFFALLERELSKIEGQLEKRSLVNVVTGDLALLQSAEDNKLYEVMISELMEKYINKTSSEDENPKSEVANPQSPTHSSRSSSVAFV